MLALLSARCSSARRADCRGACIAASSALPCSSSAPPQRIRGGARLAWRLPRVVEEIGQPQRHVLALVRTPAGDGAGELRGRVLEPVNARGALVLAGEKVDQQRAAVGAVEIRLLGDNCRTGGGSRRCSARRRTSDALPDESFLLRMQHSGQAELCPAQLSPRARHFVAGPPRLRSRP